MSNKIKEGQTYICTVSDIRWWTKGKEYKVTLNNDDLVIVDDENDKWFIPGFKCFNDIFKPTDETKMNNESIVGQTYICTNSTDKEWTVGKEYEVKSNQNGELGLIDDYGYPWLLNTLNIFDSNFKLKEEPKQPKFDLNKLTNEELRIYCDLVEAVSEAQYDLDEFIFNKMKKM